MIDYLVELQRACASDSAPLDEDAVRRAAARMFDRTADIEAALTNHDLIDPADPPRRRLEELAIPTVVIHGRDDPMFPFEHGRALAEAIPSAELLALEDVGHELPRRSWDLVVPAILASSSELRPRSLVGRDPEVGQREGGDLPEDRRRDGAADVDVLRLVDDHRDQQLRPLGGGEADEGGDVLGVRVGAVLDLLGGSRLARQHVAGNAHGRGGAARLEHALEHPPELGRDPRADHAVRIGVLVGGLPADRS